MRRFVAVAAIAAATLVGASSASAYFYVEGLAANRPLPGTWVGGQLPPQDTSLGDWLQQRGERLRLREAHLRLPEETIRVTLGELGIRLDVSTTMENVAEHAQRGSFWQRLERVWRARTGAIDLPLSWSLDEPRARSMLEALAGRVHREPVDARLDLRAHRRIDDRPGRKLDIPASLEALRAADPSEPVLVQLSTRPIPARVTSEMLLEVDVSKVLARFQTDFRNKAGSRAVNIARAADYLNETVIPPEQTISFNEVVGPRVLQRGFVYAPVIVNDELEPGIGGGVCQVATTLHAAAVYGLLDVVRRRSHSRPSGYAPLGLDATVIDGEVDLRLRNPYDTPLIIHAFLPSKYKLRVELLGREPPGKVEHTYAVQEKHDFYRRVTTKPELAPDERDRRQKGNPGYDVISLVQVRYPDGRVERHTYPSKYYPVPEVYWVGSGINPNELPELPEGATEVKVDGEPLGHPTDEPGAGGEAPRPDPFEAAFPPDS